MAFNMVKYRITVRDSDNTQLGEFGIFRNLKFGKRLNNYGQCSFEVPVSDSRTNSLVALRQYSVWIYREEDGASILVWSGEQATRKGTLDSKKNNWATIICFTWFEQLSNRFTGAIRNFSQIDQAEIAMTLIDETQAQTNGDLGITEGDIVPTFLRDRSYYNQNILDAIINLTNVIGGFDFEITDDKVFNADSIIGTDLTDNIVLEYGHNITSADITEDFSNPASRAIVLGEIKNGIYAIADFGATPATSNYLKATDFNFNIPIGATITGVELQKLGYFAGDGGGSSSAKLVKGGITGGTGLDQNFSGDEKYYSSGGISNLWGNTLTPSDINASNFGVSLYTILGSTTNSQVYINHIRLLVYYTVAGIPFVTNPTSPSSVVNDNTIGTVIWADPENALSGDATSLIRIDREDLDSQALYKIREQVISEMEISERQTFEDKGDAILRKYGSTLFSISANILPSSVKVIDFSNGDVIRLIIKNGFYNIDETYRIFEYSCEVDSLYREKLSLVLGNFTL